MKCSRYVNVGKMDVRCNGETLEDVNCFKYMGLQVAVDEGSESEVGQRMNEVYKA